MENLKKSFDIVIENYVKRFMEKQDVDAATIIAGQAQLRLGNGHVLDMNDVRYDVDTEQKKGFIFEWVKFNLSNENDVAYTRYCSGKKGRVPLTPGAIKRRIERIVGVHDIAATHGETNYITFRQIAIHYTYKHLKVSYQDLCYIYKKSTHVSIRNADKKAEAYLENDKKFKKLYNEITSQI